MILTMRILKVSFLTVMVACALPLAAQTPTEVNLNAAKDTSLFTEAEDSNGQGSHLFTGRTRNGAARRALVAFDLSSIPSGAVINSATLTLNMNRSIVGSTPVRIHRLTTDWGEGASDASGEEGKGAPAQPGDATWFTAFFDTTPWTNPGGDYIETASAQTSVGNPGSYSWSGSTVTADVQQWVDAPETNFGWILIGDPSNQSAKRYDSRSNATGPVLTVNYTVESTGLTWAGFAIAADGRSVNTEGFIGWLDIGQGDWVWSFSLGSYIYLPESSVTPGGGWVFIPKN
jgi:hypothetical protein